MSVGPYTPPTPTPTPDPTPTPTPTPATPATLSPVSATRSNETLHVSWPAVDGATGYHITYTLDGNRAWVAAATNHPANSIGIKHVLNASSYIVGVRGLNSKRMGRERGFPSSWASPDAISRRMAPGTAMRAGFGNHFAHRP